MLCLPFIQVFLYISLCYGSKVPHWEEIQCQTGHKYLFSEDTKSWTAAKVECELYGGWLVDIGSMEEYYCLIKFARAQQLFQWWWHDGNDIEEEGIYCHADGRYISWFPPKWMDDGRTLSFHGDAYDGLIFSTDTDLYAGGWYERDMSLEHNYVCESVI